MQHTWNGHTLLAQMCASTPYQLNMYDIRLLGPGGSRTDDIPENSARFYQYDRANGAATGVCISAEVQKSFTSGCSVKASNDASLCVLELRSCLNAPASSAIINAPTNSTVALALNQSRSCACYYRAQACISQNVCSDDIRQLGVAMRAQCTAARSCGLMATLCEPHALQPKDEPADVTLFVRPHDPYTGASESAYDPAFFDPPVSPSSSRWMSTPLQV